MRRSVRILKRNAVIGDREVAVDEAAKRSVALSQAHAVRAHAEGARRNLHDLSEVRHWRGELANVGVGDLRPRRSRIQQCFHRRQLRRDRGVVLRSSPSPLSATDASVQRNRKSRRLLPAPTLNSVARRPGQILGRETSTVYLPSASPVTENRPSLFVTALRTSLLPSVATATPAPAMACPFGSITEPSRFPDAFDCAPKGSDKPATINQKATTKPVKNRRFKNASIGLPSRSSRLEFRCKI